MTTTELELTAAFNFRDLGGLPAGDGTVVRRGEVYRADGIHRLSEADLDRLVETGLRTVIDLRTLGELADAPSVDHPGFEVVHLPVIEHTWTDAGRELVDADDPVAFLFVRYCEMLEEGSAALATAVEILASPARRPAVFHCSAGKDRTGVLAALLLDVLGTPHEAIAQDYARSAAAMERLVEWVTTTRPELVEHMANQPKALLACPPEAMHAFLDHLGAQHGGATGYLLGHGVTAEALGELRNRLVRRA